MLVKDSFKKDKYEEVLKMVENEEMRVFIDCYKLLDLWEEIAGTEYNKPDEKLLDKAKEATNIMEEIADKCSYKYKLKRIYDKRWIDSYPKPPNNKTYVKKYLWIQLKNDEQENSPESISVFVEIDDKNKEARFRVSLAYQYNVSNNEDITRHKKMLKKPLNYNAGLRYFIDKDSNDPDSGFSDITDSTIFEREYGEEDRIQIARIIKKEDTYSNEDMLNKIVETVGIIKEEYYDYVMDGWKESINMKNNNSQDSNNENNGISQKPLYKKYADILEKSGNIILHGAPGTGKTFLAQQIAAYIISNGECVDESGKCKRIFELDDELKKQFEFVQFHPSYDYSDFVEGLRPIDSDNSSIGFELRPGIFRNFVKKARKNFEASQKNTSVESNREEKLKKIVVDFLMKCANEEESFSLKRGNKFIINQVDDEVIKTLNENNKHPYEKLYVNNLVKMLSEKKEFERPQDVTDYLYPGQYRAESSYYYIIYEKCKNALLSENIDSYMYEQNVKRKKYVFLIDEINRGEISKIFGELFFSIDPEYRYRGKEKEKPVEISTQYSNMYKEDEPYVKFYIPENVYIIGTMNDIDRSVDTFDFAMRRRFRFIELKYDYDKEYEMLNDLNEYKEEAKKRIKSLNECIKETEDLNENYQIGPAYFRRLKDLGFDFYVLWSDYLQPLLREYIRGMNDEKIIMEKFEKAYNLEKFEDE